MEKGFTIKFHNGSEISVGAFGGFTLMADKEFKVGTWVEYTTKLNNVITGFIIGLGSRKARIICVKLKYKDKDTNKIIIELTNDVSEMYYDDLSPIDCIELTEEDIRSLIDVSLDLKDEELFYFWTEELNAMIDNDLPVLIKNT